MGHKAVEPLTVEQLGDMVRFADTSMPVVNFFGDVEAEWQRQGEWASSSTVYLWQLLDEVWRLKKEKDPVELQKALADAQGWLAIRESEVQHLRGQVEFLTEKCARQLVEKKDLEHQVGELERKIDSDAYSACYGENG